MCVQGTPQYVMMELPTPAAVRRVVIRFQGGFAGKECVLKSGDSEGDLKVVQQFYPQDNNSLQVSINYYWMCMCLPFYVGVCAGKGSSYL